MKDFAGKIAVITGGGTGMGRELARQLVAEGCSVAMCDVSAVNMAATAALCREGAPQGVRVTTHLADVSEGDQVARFQREVERDQDTDKIHLLFNNAGIGGGGSFVAGDRAEWEKTFNVCWGGVYFGCRHFLPMAMRASEAHIVNTSSVNGFWASIGPHIPHTAYCAAKFAVKGFSEALMTDLRMNAPHVKCSVVMPGHIGTEIVANSRKILSGEMDEAMSAEQVALARQRMKGFGVDADQLSDEQVQMAVADQARRFRDDAPTTAAQAAKIILDGVREEKWRILVGDDAQALDRIVRQAPEHAYDLDFFQKFAAEVGWKIGA
jgi:NAD(P)-dependent dehydrogenase (short-subunit alcohol dehydrogenase family)